MIKPIAIPKGLFWVDGFGITRMDPENVKPDPLQPAGAAGVRQDIFKMNGCHVIYGLEILDGDFNPSDDTMIIDCTYDGVLIKDPHKSTPGQFNTQYPSQKDRGLWFGFFMPKQDLKLSAPGDHLVTIQVAPLKTAQYLRPRDFSPEAGGQSATFILRILPPPPGWGQD